MARAILTPLEYAVATDPPPADVMEKINSLTSGDQNQRNAILQAYYTDQAATRDALLTQGATVENVTGAPDRVRAERLAEEAARQEALSEASQSITELERAAESAPREQEILREQASAEHQERLDRWRAAAGRAGAAGWKQKFAPSGVIYWTNPGERGSLTPEQILERYGSDASE